MVRITKIFEINIFFQTTLESQFTIDCFLVFTISLII